jgi:dTDP-4-dehydrorhamnose reductase
MSNARDRIMTRRRAEAPAGDPHAPTRNSPALELWGGVECTVNRVGDRYFDQLQRNGHYDRIQDLVLFRDLGLRTLRYPVLWERTAPQGPAGARWDWADARLGRLRELDIQPIVGLVHHGSGPEHTSLLDPAFPEGLAEYAGAVAERYPWVERYTPVNEPLTTARFSGLYGHWYPHARDGHSFLRAVIHQCRATVLAMRAIREVNPHARMVQTEDLGKTFSTPALAYQATFDNERRWLSWDLLCGRVDREHLLWDWLTCEGIPVSDLEWFLEYPCPPDVIGVNHYVTSDRFLDERLERYPESTHGANNVQAYADVEAVRVCAEGPAGPETVLREAWERYRIPLAVTEAHLGCTRDEQLRWLLEVWETAGRLQAEGIGIQAVTAWSLLGAYDWNSLLTCDHGVYEPGAFDLRGGSPRPTALARLLHCLASGRRPEHPVLATPGWWRRPERLLYPPVSMAEPPDSAGETGPATPPPARWSTARSRPRPLLIAGAGTLGRGFARLCDERGLPYRLLRRAELDVAVRFSVEDALDELEPWAVVNAAGYARREDAEREPERCFRENAEGAAVLAAACARRGIPLVTFSTDRVFDGRKGSPYVEDDPVGPLEVYGRSKAEAERRVLELCPEALVVRAGLLFGSDDGSDALAVALRALAEGQPPAAAGDGVFSATHLPDLVHAALDLLIDGERGLWHLANPGEITWPELVRWAAALTGIDTARLEIPGHATEATRSTCRALGSRRGVLLPPLEQALEAYFQRVPAPGDASILRFTGVDAADSRPDGVVAASG